MAKSQKYAKCFQKKIARGLPVVNPRVLVLSGAASLAPLCVMGEVVEELVLEVGEVLVQEEQVEEVLVEEERVEEARSFSLPGRFRLSQEKQEGRQKKEERRKRKE